MAGHGRLGVLRIGNAGLAGNGKPRQEGVRQERKADSRKAIGLRPFDSERLAR